MRKIGVVVVALLALVPGLTARADEAPAPAAPATRASVLHVPPHPPDADRALVVYLHGCVQTAAQAEAATGFSKLADERGFYVLYPQQNVTPGTSAPMVDGNGIGCWNWFLPDNQERDKGEPAVIAALTRKVVADHDIDPRRVYVNGISAGADMAVILAATYPDLFAAVGAVQGCPFKTCTDATGRLAYDAMGPRARAVPMFAVQGTADTLNNVAMGQALVDSWVGLADWVDNGAADGTVSHMPSTVEHRYFDQTPAPGSGDACVRNQNWPCPGGVVGFQGSYPTSVLRYLDSTGCPVVESWLVHGMEHAQPNSTTGPYNDPLGPDITTATWRFFEDHPMGRDCREG